MNISKDTMYMALGITVALVAVILILYYVAIKLSEGFYPFYYDQMAMKHYDPMFIHYKGSDRDILGMSRRDYYLEHDLNTRTGAEDYNPSDIDSQFSNTTNYLGINSTYRPKSSIKDVIVDHV